MSSLPEVTVIILMYKSSSTIVRALRSLDSMFEFKLDLILIDDHSCDDASLLAIDFLLNKKKVDWHFRVIENIWNQGAYFGRNLGVDLAVGQYVLFVDGDDELTADFGSQLKSVCCLSSEPIDIIFFDLLLRRPNEKDQIMQSIDLSLGVPFGYIKALPSPCNKVVSKKVYQRGNIRFPHTIYEDLATSYRLVVCANSFYYIQQPLYVYNKANYGNVSSIYDNRLTQIFPVVKDMIDYIQLKMPSISQVQLMDIAVPTLFNQYLAILSIDDMACVRNYYHNVVDFLDQRFGKVWRRNKYFTSCGSFQKLLRMMLKSKCSFMCFAHLSFLRGYIREHYRI